MQKPSGLSSHASDIPSPPERWVERNVDRIALGVMAAGLLIRLCFAARSFLNPDECMHFLFSHQASWREVWLATQTTMHPYPPLLALLLHALQVLGTGELLLRASSVLPASAALWFAHRWMVLVFDRATAFLGLVILAFAPGSISIGVEVRSYALLVCGLAACLYYTERAIRERSRTCLAWSLFWCMVAVWSHYSAVWICLSLGIWILWRFWRGSAPRSLVTSWAGCQLSVVLVYYWFYTSHIVRLRGSGNEYSAITGFLKESYFQPDTDSVWLFSLRQTAALFSFLLGAEWLGIGGAVALVCAAGWLIARSWRDRSFAAQGHALLLLLPFTVGLTGALSRMHPYGGSRHASYLFLFAAAALGWVVAAAWRARITQAVMTGAGVAAVLVLGILPGNPALPWVDRDIRHARDAVEYLRTKAAPGAPIFADHESFTILAYYLGRSEFMSYRKQPEDFLELTFEGHPVYAQTRQWTLGANECRNAVAYLASLKRLKVGDVWLFEATLGTNVADELKARPELPKLVDERRFGKQIAVFRFAE